MRAWRESWADAALTVAVGAVTLAGLAAELVVTARPHPPAVWACLLALTATAPLLVRRRAPVAAALGGLLAAYVYNAAGYPGLAPALPLFAVCYSITAYGRSSWSLATGMAVVGAASVIPTLPPGPMAWTSFPVLGPSAAMAWMVVLGAAARSRRLAADARLEHARTEAARRLAAERIAVAREVHDVLAHTITTISIQSGLALDALDSDPEQARSAMAAVRAAAKQARPQVRAALELLRGDVPGAPDDPLAAPPVPAGRPVAALDPQPGFGQLARLAGQAREAGLRVHLTAPPDAAEVPPLLQLTAYRIVQEALTNVLKHSGARQAWVDVRVAGGGVVVDVTDDGGAGHDGEPDPHPAGFGLRGMRERAASVGGTLTAGPRPGAGFHVRAELPMEDGW
ncbi:signal transduction histidine kinase [Thermocatellispora tengchongensis]|uniref:histidine kinase n=1 Tax=Thermocatellispora tengchongensis TaxID=1073253 RepID=A0A840PFW5_9ACTN|nr:histidine kinase [Thermocatellispora tengchongensis]MBB5136731.1 signal transduction histidine kinase [Thermocatellispora tengchongensis]